MGEDPDDQIAHPEPRDRGINHLATDDPHALRRLAVARGRVAASVGVAGHGEDPEVEVQVGLVPRDRVPRITDVDAVRIVLVRDVLQEEVPCRAGEALNPVVAVRFNRVHLHQAGVDIDEPNPDHCVVEHVVGADLGICRGEHPDAGRPDPGRAIVVDRVVSDRIAGRALSQDPSRTRVVVHLVPIDRVVVAPEPEHDPRTIGRDIEPMDLVVARAEQIDALVELLDRAVLDLDVVEPARVVDSTGATEAIAVDEMAAEVELDVVGPDDEPVAGTVQQVVRDLRVLGDDLAAGDRRGRRVTGPERQ